MTREEAIKCIQEEKLRYERAPWLNGSPMMEEWQKAIDICDIALSAIRAKPEQESKPLNGWISVEERLPEAGEHYQSDDVLICIDYRPNDPEITEDTYVSIDHVDFNCFGQGCFSCERDDPRGGEPSPYFVTHWMPMPEPPERKKTEE